MGGHLKHDAVTGHLLHTKAGHLVNDCEEPEPPPENTCNDCVPAIPDTLFVTFAGLAGDFAIYNGKHQLFWHHDCLWADLDYPVADDIWLDYMVSPAGWVVRIVVQSGCSHTWNQGDDLNPCSPTEAFVLQGCLDVGCMDTNSCEDSAGATCVISLT